MMVACYFLGLCFLGVPTLLLETRVEQAFLLWLRVAGFHLAGSGTVFMETTQRQIGIAFSAGPCRPHFGQKYSAQHGAGSIHPRTDKHESPLWHL